MGTDEAPIIISCNEEIFPLTRSPSIKFQVSSIFTTMKINLKHLAEACGMDISTVSRALRNDPRVKEKTRDKIKKLASEMGYRPNLAARNLVAGKSKTIWFMLPSLCHAVEQMPAQHSAMYLTKQYNYDMLVAFHHNDEETYTLLIDRLTQGIADGVIIIPGPTKTGGEYVTPLLQQNYPLVFLDRHPKDIMAPCVVTDNFNASFQMIEDSYKNGARAVIDITSDSDNNAANERSKGVREACIKNEIPLYHCNQETIISEKLPAKINLFGSVQSHFFEFLQKNHELPKTHEISINCFDQWWGDPFPAKKVVVAKQDFTKMAEIACDMLVEIINGKKVTKRIQVPIAGIEEINSAG